METSSNENMPTETDHEHSADIDMEPVQATSNSNKNEANINSETEKPSSAQNASQQQQASASSAENNGAVSNDNIDTNHFQQLDKENQNTLNEVSNTNDNQQHSNEEPQCLRYHGEYNHLLVDLLNRLLDDTFNGWIESYKPWASLFETSMKNEPNKILYFYPILLKELKQKIQQHYIAEFERIETAQHLAALHNREAFTLYKDADITPSGVEVDHEDDDDGKDSNESSDVLKEKQEEEEADGEVIRYKQPKVTVRDRQLKLINQTFMKEINVLDQKIALAKYKKNELIATIEQKKKTLFGK